MSWTPLLSSSAQPGTMGSTWRTRSTTVPKPSGSIPKRELSAIILFRLRSCKPLIEIAEMKKRREESLANPQPENNPQWEEMEEVLVSVDVDGWEIYVKETRPKGQRLPNEVDPERAQLHYTPLVKDQSDAGSASSLAR